jgi:hypothetical protein
MLFERARKGLKKRRQHCTARGDIIVVFGNFGSFSRAVFWE